MANAADVKATEDLNSGTAGEPAPKPGSKQAIEKARQRRAEEGKDPKNRVKRSRK